MRTQRRSPTLSDFPYTPLAAAVALALAPHAAQAAAAGCTVGTTICVNSPGDTNAAGGGQFVYGGEVDLRGALTACTGGTIRFDLTDVRYNALGGPFVIQPSLALPASACNIDGEGLSTDAAPRITVDGSAADALTFPSGLPYGITSATGVGVNGLAVTNIHNGAALQGSINASNNIVSNSVAGISVAGTVDSNLAVNNTTGINALFSNQSIQNNTVYGNNIGIEVDDVSPSITGNTIGLGPLLATGNATGIAVLFGAPTISGNVISNNDIGIMIEEDNGTTIDSNFIGTDASGSTLHANQVGIATSFAYGTSITGNTIAAPLTGTAIDIEDDSRNVTISGNTINTNPLRNALLGGGEAIVGGCSTALSVNDNTITTKGRNAIDFGAMSSSTIQDNAIGATALGSATQLGSVLNGISLHDAVCNLGLVAKSARAKVGLASPTDGTGIFFNTIYAASQNGIVIDNANNTDISSQNFVGNSNLYGVEILAGTGNHIVQNYIYGNGVTLGAGAKNLDLDFHGSGPNPSLPNDSGDTDSGPNDGQNYPSSISVHYHPDLDQTQIEYTLDSAPGTYRIDAYENVPATTVPGGTPIFSCCSTRNYTVPGGVDTFFISGRHDSISLTASSLDVNGNPFDTSEFSPVQNTTLVPNATVSPTAVNFGAVPINTSSGPRSVTVRSTGTDTYVMHHYGDSTCYGGPICYGGAFTCTSTCAEGFTDYAPGGGCGFTVTFNPTFVGSFSQTIQICDNTATHIRNISILGQGIIPPPLVFTPPEFDFGNVAVGHTSPPEVFTVSNPSSTPIDIGAPSASGDFVIGANGCGTNLNANDSCTISVNFVPVGPGERNGELSVPASSGAPAAKRLQISHGARFVKPEATEIAGPVATAATAALTGTGVVAGVLVLPDVVDFGANALGAQPITRTVTLHNTGNKDVKITTLAVSAPFTMTNDCPAILTPDQSCTLTLTFSSTTLGEFTGNLTVVSDAAGGSGSILVKASTVGVAQAILEVTPKTIGFGSRMIGTSQGTQRVTIKNIGSADATLAPITFDGGDYGMTGSSCGPTLTPGSTCFADVQFLPLGFGLRKEHLSVNGNAVNAPVSVELAGTGCRPFSVTGGASSCSP